MIIVCDLDRTLVPNGKEEYDNSLSEFYKRISQIDDIVLAYATGRNLELFRNAEENYEIKKPDYLLASVGTEVYLNVNSKMIEDPDWDNYVHQKHPNWNREKITQDLLVEFQKDLELIYLQEESVQNKNKISFYLKKNKGKENYLNFIQQYLDSNNIKAEVVYSFDPHKNLGLIDVLPRHATKLGAVEFLVNKLGQSLDDVIYCGDSGNDLLPLTAGIKAILVNNASEEVKQQALEIVKEKGFEDKLYVASGNGRLNGNYSSGVIEGLEYFGVI